MPRAIAIVPEQVALDLDFGNLPIESIDPSPDNPRTDLELDADFIASIKAHGVIEPIVVHVAEGYEDAEPNARRYVVQFGHRRLAGAAEAGQSTIPAIVRPAGEPADLAVTRLIENLHRTDLSPLDEAGAYRRLVDDYGMKQADVATAVARNQGHVSKRLSLLRLEPELRALVGTPAFPLDVAVDASRLPRAFQVEVAEDAARGTAYLASSVRNAAGRVESLAERGRAIKAAKEAPHYLVIDKSGALPAFAEGGEFEGAQRLVELGLPDPAAHIAEAPCRLVVVGASQEYVRNPLDPSSPWISSWSVEYCTEPESHADATPVGTGSSSSRSGMTAKEKRAQAAADKAQDAFGEARAALHPEFRANLATLVTGKLPATTQAFIDRLTVADLLVNDEGYDRTQSLLAAAEVLSIPVEDLPGLLITGSADQLRRVALTGLLIEHVESSALALWDVYYRPSYADGEVSHDFHGVDAWCRALGSLGISWLIAAGMTVPAAWSPEFLNAVADLDPSGEAVAHLREYEILPPAYEPEVEDVALPADDVDEVSPDDEA